MPTSHAPETCRCTILSENTASPSLGVLAEHGFAVLVETPALSLLFDTGQGHCLCHNARVMECDLASVDALALSHGHYDHTGGMPDLLGLHEQLTVYAHPDIFCDRYARLGRASAPEYRYVGPPATREEFERDGARFSFNRTFVELADGVYLTGEVPRTTDFEGHDARLVVRTAAGYESDPLRDDQSLVVRTPRGLVVVLGCAHAGLINTLQHITDNLPDDSLYMVFGGTHVGFLTDRQVEQSIAALAQFDLQRIGVSHCTGLPRSMLFRQAFGDRFFFANAGVVLTV